MYFDQANDKNLYEEVLILCFDEIKQTDPM